ncbi:MAG: hypothetical protein ACRDN0_02140, partial [Trebonia sp.]
PQYPDAAANASGGQGALRQEGTGRHRQQVGALNGLEYAPGLAPGPYPASPAAGESRQAEPYQPEQSQDPGHPLVWPQQQAYTPGPQPQAPRALRRPGRYKARDALIGLGALIGIIIIVLTVATGHRSSSSSGNAAPSCISQVAAWRNSDGLSGVQAVATDMYNLGSADEALYHALTARKDASAHEPKLQTTAASVQADARTAEANLPPSCMPNFRSELRAGFNDADQAGIDSGHAVSEFTSGNYSVATSDVRAADKAENAGNAKIQAAAADLKAYEKG